MGWLHTACPRSIHSLGHPQLRAALPQPHFPLSKEFPPNVQLKSPLLYLKAIPLVGTICPHERSLSLRFTSSPQVLDAHLHAGGLLGDISGVSLGLSCSHPAPGPWFCSSLPLALVHVLSLLAVVPGQVSSSGLKLRVPAIPVAAGMELALCAQRGCSAKATDDPGRWTTPLKTSQEFQCCYSSVPTAPLSPMRSVPSAAEVFVLSLCRRRVPKCDSNSSWSS